MPNSLIFVVILAVWAAYLIQHWIRRRDHVATARSVDRFSEAMRVLERRQRLPRADLSAAAPRSYSVSVTRPAHPDVVVKRAQHTVAAGVANGSTAPAARPVARTAARGSAARGSSRSRTPLVRAVALIVGVLALGAGVTVWAMGVAQWWAAVAGLATLLLALTFVRFSVGAQRRRATSPVRARSTRSQVRPARAARPAPTARRRPDTASAPAVVSAQTELAAPTEASARSIARATELYDVEAMEVSVGATAQTDTEFAVATEAAEPGVEAADTGAVLEPGTWAPVPVPPPTYTLKAKAIRTPAGPIASTEVEDLPFDGHALALDEEFEELPSVHHVG